MVSCGKKRLDLIPVFDVFPNVLVELLPNKPPLLELVAVEPIMIVVSLLFKNFKLWKLRD